jgi:predicted DNA-binding transcriptional regulator AlpA
VIIILSSTAIRDFITIFFGVNDNYIIKVGERMITERVATDFLEGLAEKVAEKLLPKVIDQLQNELGIKEDKTLNVAEAAPYIGISAEMLYRLCDKKMIPHVRLSSSGTGRPRILFSSASIDAWRKEQERLNYRKE